MTFSNGPLVVAVAVLVDAIFGVLLALGVIQSKPDQGLILAVVTSGANIGAFVLAYIQHQQHVVKLTLASHERMAQLGAGR